MGDEMMRSDLSMTECFSVMAIDYPDEYDSSHIGMESAFPALQALRWQEPSHHAVQLQGVL